MDLFGELFFTKFIKGKEFSGKDFVRIETTGGQFDTLLRVLVLVYSPK